MSSRLTEILALLLILWLIPAAIFCFWLINLPEKVDKLCPEECRCDLAGYRVNCSSSSLNNITSLHLTNIRELTLNDSSMPSLEKDSFISRGLTELEKLHLEWCELETIELEAFNGLRELTHLSLSHNKIHEIIPGTFDNLGALKYLDLEDNVIEHLEVDVFCGLVNLKKIHLEGNKLLGLHPNLFLGLYKLQSLYLSNNPDLEIPIDRLLINSHSLSSLDISSCNVSSVSVATFANVTALELLDLSHNNLRSVDVNILKVLPKLSELYLYENPLQCDCQLQEVWRWCQDQDIQTGLKGKEPHCVISKQWNSLPWGVLEERRCLQGNIKFLAGYEHKKQECVKDEIRLSYEDIIYYTDQIRAAVCAVPFIFGITINTIILTIITFHKAMRTLPNMYIINLAISDMIDLTIFFFLPLGDYASFKLQCVDIFRLFLAFFHHFSVCLSAYSVVVLNFLRYKVKVKPFHVCFSSHMPWHVAVVKLSRVWGVAAVFAFATMWMVIVLECDTFSDEMYHKYVGLFDLLVTCALPLSVMAICYIMTERLHVECSCSKSERTQPPGLNTCKVTEKVVSAINLVFLFSYVPNCALQTYAGFNMIGDFSVKVYNKWFLNAFSTFILLTNSCLYPVAVFCSNHAFRKYLKHYLPRCCTTNSPPTVIELVRKN